MEPTASTSSSLVLRRALVGLMCGGLMAGVVAACSGGGDDSADGTTTTVELLDAAPPETAAIGTIPVPPDFVIPDTRGVALAPVESKEKPGPTPGANVLPVRGGTSKVRVRVQGISGEGSLVVRFERIAGGLVGWEDVRTNRSGVAELDGAVGGRYRVRAWRSPDLATTESQLAFVGRDEEVEVAVRVERHDAIVISGALTVPTWRVGSEVPLQVLAVREAVDGNGRVGGSPVVAQVSLVLRGGVGVEGESVVTTDGGSGTALFTLRCAVPGNHVVDISAEGSTVSVPLPECLPGVASTTTTSQVVADSATSTTRATTTSTTRPRPTTTRAGGDR